MITVIMIIAADCLVTVKGRSWNKYSQFLFLNFINLCKEKKLPGML